MIFSLSISQSVLKHVVLVLMVILINMIESQTINPATHAMDMSRAAAVS